MQLRLLEKKVLRKKEKERKTEQARRTFYGIDVSRKRMEEVEVRRRTNNEGRLGEDRPLKCRSNLRPTVIRVRDVSKQRINLKPIVDLPIMDQDCRQVLGFTVARSWCKQARRLVRVCKISLDKPIPHERFPFDRLALVLFSLRGGSILVQNDIRSFLFAQLSPFVSVITSWPQSHHRRGILHAMDAPLALAHSKTLPSWPATGTGTR
jgi:hypothetical protein